MIQRCPGPSWRAPGGPEGGVGGLQEGTRARKKDKKAREREQERKRTKNKRAIIYKKNQNSRSTALADPYYYIILYNTI